MDWKRWVVNEMFPKPNWKCGEYISTSGSHDGISYMISWNAYTVNDNPIRRITLTIPGCCMISGDIREAKIVGNKALVKGHGKAKYFKKVDNKKEDKVWIWVLIERLKNGSRLKISISKDGEDFYRTKFEKNKTPVYMKGKLVERTKTTK